MHSRYWNHFMVHRYNFFAHILHPVLFGIEFIHCFSILNGSSIWTLFSSSFPLFRNRASLGGLQLHIFPSCASKILHILAYNYIWPFNEPVVVRMQERMTWHTKRNILGFISHLKFPVTSGTTRASMDSFPNREYVLIFPVFIRMKRPWRTYFKKFHSLDCRERVNIVL